MSMAIPRARGGNSPFAAVRIMLSILCLCWMLPFSAAGSDQPVPEIVVTGTHIRGPIVDGLSPVRSLDRDELLETGAPVIMDVVKYLAVNTGSEFNTDSSTQNQSSGTGQLNLRGLGLGTTLVLINGRRQALSGTIADDGSTFVDINNIPMVMIKRVDILKDGASAIYGSDAMAGVVNFTTRSDFEGFETEISYQSTTEDNQEDVTISSIMGTGTAHGHAVAGFSFFNRTDLTSPERDFTEGTGISSLGQPGAFIPLGVPNPPFDAIPPGLPIIDPACGTEAGGILPETAPVGTCNLDFGQFLNLVTEEERINGFAEGHYEVSQDVEVYTEVLFARNRVERPQTPSFPILKFPVIPADNPGNIFGVPAVFLGRALGETFPPSISEHDSDTWRLVAGVKGDVIGNWTWDLAYSYSANQFVFTIPDQLQDRFEAALNGNGGPNDNQFFNPFGSSKLDPALANPTAVLQDITGRARMQSDSELATIDLIFSGDSEPWLTLPDGRAVGIAFGAQIRRPELDTDWDDNYNRENFLFLDGGPDFKGSREVTAFFGELAIPLLDNLDAQVALRAEDYDDIGSSTDPKLAIRWQPVEWLTLRGSAGTAFRAPSLLQTTGALVNLGELFDPATESTVFRGVRTLGSEELNPEEADTYSGGITIQPRANLRFGLDYWRFEVEDIVVRENAQAIVTADPFDPRIIRDPVSGQISIVEANFVNAPNVDTDGFDFNVHYTRDTGFGRWMFNADATFIREFEIRLTPDSAPFDVAGMRNFTNFARSLPEWRANANIGWSLGNHSANIFIRFIDSYEDDQNCKVTSSINSAICAVGARIDNFTSTDLQYRYAFPNLLGEEMLVTVGAINLFDEDPPRVNTNSGYDVKVHDPRGRLVYLKLKQQF